MFQFQIASLLAMPLAATEDQLQPWVIAAIAGGALLALLLIIFAARKMRGSKGDDIREAMEAAKMEAAENTGEIGAVPGAVASTKPVESAPDASAAKGKSSSKGKHAK